MADKLLTPQEIADRLQVKLRTAYEYLAPGGPLYHLRIELGPKTVRVDPQAFENYIKQGPAEHANS